MAPCRSAKWSSRAVRLCPGVPPPNEESPLSIVSMTSPATANLRLDAFSELRVRVGETPGRAARTPYLELDVDRVIAQLQRMRQAMPAVAVHYAVKCNPEPAVLARLAAEGCGFEIASTTELR